VVFGGSYGRPGHWVRFVEAVGEMGVGWPEESVLFGEVQRQIERGTATGRLGGSGLEGAEAVLGVGVRVQGRDRLRCSLRHRHRRRRRRRRRLRRHRSEIRRHLWRRRRRYPRTRTVRLVCWVSEIGGPYAEKEWQLVVRGEIKTRDC
jgi:hypothetical protein